MSFFFIFERLCCVLKSVAVENRVFYDYIVDITDGFECIAAGVRDGRLQILLHFNQRVPQRPFMFDMHFFALDVFLFAFLKFRSGAEIFFVQLSVDFNRLSR